MKKMLLKLKIDPTEITQELLDTKSVTSEIESENDEGSEDSENDKNDGDDNDDENDEDNNLIT